MSWQGLNEESNPRTLYVGNLDASVSEDLICALFSQIGSVKGCKIIRELSQYCKANTRLYRAVKIHTSPTMIDKYGIDDYMERGPIRSIQILQ